MLKFPLPPGIFSTLWFDIRKGGDLMPAKPIAGPGQVALGWPPRDVQNDWVVLVRRRK